MKRYIGIALIILSIFLGYQGINAYSNSSASVDIVGVEISAEDNSKKSTAFLYLGLAVVAFGGGLYLIRGKS